MQNLEWIIGIALTLALGYLLARWLWQRRQLKSDLLAITQQQKIYEKYPKLPQDEVKQGEVTLTKNLDTEKIQPNLQLVLQLLSQYKNNPSAELLEALRHALSKHNEAGENALHEYLHQEHVEIESIEEMMEINHELLTETDHEGNHALHLAEHHGHHEAAEWMVEHERFESEHERHHFLSHHNHAGHTALHDAAHLWHYHSPHDHFFHMVEEHPTGSLMWKDNEGKTVYEYFFEHPHADRHGLLEALEHKGVIHKHGEHYELSHEAEEHVRTAHHSKNLTQLGELLVRDYSPIHHQPQSDLPSEVSQVKNEPKHEGHRHLKHRPH